MSLAIRFTEHDEFHRETLHATVAGGLCGLATHVGALAFPQTTLFDHGGAWALSALGAASIYAITARKQTSIGWLLKVIGGAAAAAVAMILLGRESGEPALGFAAWAVCFGALLAAGNKGWRWVGVAAATTGALLLGCLIANKLFAGVQLAKVPPFARAALGGAGFGLLAAVGAASRYLTLRSDPARAAYQAAAPKLNGELGDLAERAHATHVRIEEVLDARSGERAEQTARQIRESSAALVIQICSIGTQWTEVETEGARTSPESLSLRLAAIDGKIAATQDAIAREQYAIARASVVEQQRYLAELSMGRDRVIARTHAHLAALEKLRLAVVNLRSVDAQRLASGVQPLLEEIRNLSTEFDIRSQALGEAEAHAEAARKDAAPDMAPATIPSAPVAAVAAVAPVAPVAAVEAPVAAVEAPAAEPVGYPG